MVLQGGEFAFVLLALANRLEILPEELNRLLIIVVVLSMALTPVLTEVGKQAGKLVASSAGEGEPAGVVVLLLLRLAGRGLRPRWSL